MSKEAKIGLLVGLGIILVFALILERRLSGEGHANLGDEPDGSHIVQADIGAADSPRGDAESGTIPADDAAALSDLSGAEGPAPFPAGSDLADGSLPGRNEYHGYLTMAPGGADAASPGGPPEPGPAADEGAGGRVEPQPAEPPTRFYTVKPGDSFYRIAEEVLGAGQGPKWKVIARLNPNVDPSRLKPGMKLVVPTETRERTPEPVAEPPQPAPGRREERSPASGQRTYVVAQGDTLGDISTKFYGTSRKWELIASANKGVNPRSMPIGTKLVIPEVPAPESEPAVAVTTPDGGAIDRALEGVRTWAKASFTVKPETYKVQPGDTFYTISQKMLGSGERWREIYDLNRDKVPNPKALPVGREIRLPLETRVAMADPTGF